MNQLTEVAKLNMTTEKYFYDTLGNRVRKENWVCSAFINASDYKYGIQNRLTDINIQSLPVFGKGLINQTIQMGYDERGNLIKTTSGNSVLSQYTFDVANRLSEATNVLGIKTNFIYDGAGRRIKMRIDLPKPNIHNIFKPGLSSLFNSKNQAHEKDTCSWLYNGKDYKLEYNYVLDITEPYENVLMIYGEGIDTQRYTYGLEVLSLDTWNKSVSPWFQNCDKEITSQKVDRGYYLQDELGSPVRIVGEAGNTKAIYSYDASGRPIIPVNLISNCKTRGNIYSYTGYQYDLPTGLMYAQARYYMPEVGRFISEDAYKGTVAEPGSLNWYVYCRNNPVNYVDPSGYDSYVFYEKKDWQGQAESLKKVLEKKYGSPVHMKEIKTEDDFIKAWNNMGAVVNDKEEAKDVKIEGVVLIFHGSPHTININADSDEYLTVLSEGKTPKGFDATYIGSLDKKDIDELLILSCNAGHLDHYDDNVAMTFNKHHNINAVIGCDGNVAFSRKYGLRSWGFGDYIPRLSGVQKSFYANLVNGYRKPYGFVVY